MGLIKEIGERYRQVIFFPDFGKNINDSIVELVKLESSCVEDLSLFLLRGEYINSLEEVKNEIYSFKSVVQETPLPTLAQSCVQASQLSNGVKKNEAFLERARFGNRFEVALIGIQELLTVVDGKIHCNGKRSLTIVYSNLTKEAYDGLLSFFSRFVLPICIQDHILSLSTELDEIKKMVTLYEQLKREEEEVKTELPKTTLIELLKKKYEFVIYKYLASKEIASRNDKGRGYVLDYQFNFETCSIDIDKIEKATPYLHFFRVVHLEEKLQESEKHIETFDTVARRVVFLKYQSTKDIKEEIINRIILEYEKTQKMDSKSDFDLYAWRTVINFLYNCRFSYYLKYPIKKYPVLSEQLRFLKEKLKEISDLQEETGIFNYFPYLKSLEFLEQRIQEEFRNERLDDGLSEAIKYAIVCFSRFEECLQWCNENYFLPIQLPFEECQISLGREKLFISSSFTRPHDQRKLSIRQEEFRTKIFFWEEQKRSFDFGKNALHDAQNLKKQIFSLGGGGIAVLVFLLGTISLINNGIRGLTLDEMFSLVIGIGIPLLLFVSAIYIIAMRPHEKMHKDPRFVFFTILFLVSLALMFSFQDLF